MRQLRSWLLIWYCLYGHLCNLCFQYSERISYYSFLWKDQQKRRLTSYYQLYLFYGVVAVQYDSLVKDHSLILSWSNQYTALCRKERCCYGSEEHSIFAVNSGQGLSTSRMFEHRNFIKLRKILFLEELLLQKLYFFKS